MPGMVARVAWERDRIRGDGRITRVVAEDERREGGVGGWAVSALPVSAAGGSPRTGSVLRGVIAWRIEDHHVLPPVAWKMYAHP